MKLKKVNKKIKIELFMDSDGKVKQLNSPEGYDVELVINYDEYINIPNIDDSNEKLDFLIPDNLLKDK